MEKNVELLSRHLNLSEFQSRVLRENCDRYDMSRLEKRGGVLYAPHRAKKGNLFERARRILRGAAADLIGADKMLVRGRCGVRFCAHGMHVVQIGKFKCYCDHTGCIISREDFYRATRGQRR